MTSLIIFFEAAGALLAALSLPLIWRKVGPNPWYGFRVRQTLDDPAIWYPVNAYAAKGLLALALGICAASGLLYLVPDIDVGVYASTVAVLALTGLALIIIFSWRFLRRLANGPDEPN